MIYGDDVKLTLDRNWFHDLSGRAPKIGGSGSMTVQAVNNYFSSVGRHDFDIGTGASVLIEGNRFENVDTPITSDSASAGGATFNVPDTDSQSTSSSYLGRKCVTNALTNSGAWTSLKSTKPLQDLANNKDYLVNPLQIGYVKGEVTGNAGIGKIGN